MSDEDLLMNTTDVRSEEEFEVGYTHRVIGATVLCIISLVGIFGNSLVILAVSVSRKLQTITNVFVVSLSITDLLTCASLPFQSLGLVHPAGWPLDPTFCPVIGASIYILTLTSVFTLANIAFNRYYLITRRREAYQWLYKPSKLCMMQSLAWLQAILCLAIPELINIETLGYSDEQHWCSWLSKPEDPIGIYETIAFVNIFLAFLVILFCYVKIFMRVREQRKVMASANDHASQVPTAASETDLQPDNQQNTTNKPDIRRRDSQINKNLFSVVCAFFLCVMPHTLCVLIPGHEIPSIYTFILMSANCCINPLIYADKHPHFKQVFGCLLRCQYDKIPNPVSWVRMYVE
ncbi:melatonin receptor type 1B-A-like [Lytechinus pictus]|uniref:melatonin receptor type 1B-A-like n=1 Tax=Lytechinus pictus TaxID=7653 RepID=UPI0030BA149B